MGDSPEELVRTARSMATSYSYNGKLAPWWATGAAVAGLADVAADTEHPLSDVALVALQVMSVVYNERVR